MKLASLFTGLVLSLSFAAVPVAAHEVQYAAVLNGPSEALPNESPGVGTALVTFDLDLITMRVQTSFSDLIGNVTASHIHCCTDLAGTGAAGVATQTPTFIDFPLGGTSGSYDHTFDMTQASSYNPAFVTANTDVSHAFTALFNGIDSGKAYLNVHSSFAPAGGNPRLPRAGAGAFDLRADVRRVGHRGRRGEAAPRKLIYQTASSSARNWAAAKSRSPL